ASFWWVRSRWRSAFWTNTDLHLDYEARYRFLHSPKNTWASNKTDHAPDFLVAATHKDLLELKADGTDCGRLRLNPATLPPEPRWLRIRMRHCDILRQRCRWQRPQWNADWLRS